LISDALSCSQLWYDRAAIGYAKRAGKEITHIRKNGLETLQEYSWPGNVRELQNVIERSLIVSETNEFSIDKSWVSKRTPTSESRGL
jgi:transcriptional regulator with PAS, ATPase and Fis domain